MFTADNMSRFLGQDASDQDATRFGEYLESRGWELLEEEGQMFAYKGGRPMQEWEWHEALADCFR